MENHMCFLLVRYVDLIIQCTKQHFIIKLWCIIEILSFKVTKRQVSVMSDRDPEKFYCTHCSYWQKALKLALFWVGR